MRTITLYFIYDYFLSKSGHLNVLDVWTVWCREILVSHSHVRRLKREKVELLEREFRKSAEKRYSISSSILQLQAGLMVVLPVTSKGARTVQKSCLWLWSSQIKKKTTKKKTKKKTLRRKGYACKATAGKLCFFWINCCHSIIQFL